MYISILKLTLCNYIWTALCKGQELQHYRNCQRRNRQGHVTLAKRWWKAAISLQKETPRAERSGDWDERGPRGGAEVSKIGRRRKNKQRWKRKNVLSSPWGTCTNKRRAVWWGKWKMLFGPLQLFGSSLYICVTRKRNGFDWWIGITDISLCLSLSLSVCLSVCLSLSLSLPPHSFKTFFLLYSSQSYLWQRLNSIVPIQSMQSRRCRR